MRVIIGGMLGFVWGLLWLVLVYFALRSTTRQQQDRHGLAGA